MIVIGARFQGFDQPGSMGVVNGVRYIRCFWPKLDRPTALFADGSSDIVVQGPPTPRNVVFPPDTVFATYHPDAVYPADVAVMARSPSRNGMVALTGDEAAAWLATYENAAVKLPETSAVHATRDDVYFLRRKEASTEYVAELSRADALAIADGSADLAQIEADAVYVDIKSSRDDAATKVYKVEGGALVEVAKP